MDYFKEDVEPELSRRSSRYSEDYFYDRHDRYDYDRDIDYYSSHASLDDPYRMPRPLLPRPPRDRDMPPPSLHDMPYKEPVPESAVAVGRIVIYPLSPLDPKPSRRTKPISCKTIFVGSLPDTCLEKHLIELFSACGTVVEVRISRGRNFGHVQFSQESSVERAMNLSGCKIRIDNSPLPKDCSRIHVDYAQDKAEVELKRKMETDEVLTYNSTVASNISADLHKDGVFCYAAKNVATWLGRGECKADNANTFFDLVTNVNKYGRKVAKYIQNKEEEEFEFKVKKQEYFNTLDEECQAILKVYENAALPKAWNCFTKPQRKSITQWKEQAMDIQERIHQKLDSSGNSDNGESEPPAKVMKLEAREAEANLEKAHREIEQLKVDRDVAVDKRDKQILQLKTLMAKFKKAYPNEWKEALGVTSKSESDVSMKEEDKDDSLEVIDGVGMDDLNNLMDQDASNTSLASAAAAYASMRKTVGSEEVAGLGLSEPEVAIVTVLAAFLTVHPLGATIESITAYFQNFNPAYNSYYLESLLRRLSKVFQVSDGTGGTSGTGGSGGADGGEGSNKRWWFMGFQTCYDTPNASKEVGSATEQAKTS